MAFNNEMGKSSSFMGDIPITIADQESIKQIIKTPLNSISRGQAWQRPCIQTWHVKKLWVPKNLHLIYDMLIVPFQNRTSISKAQLLERQARDRNVMGSIPSRNGRRTYISRVDFLCWFLSSVCSTRPTAVACKRLVFPHKVQMATYR